MKYKVILFKDKQSGYYIAMNKPKIPMTINRFQVSAKYKYQLDDMFSETLLNEFLIAEIDNWDDHKYNITPLTHCTAELNLCEMEHDELLEMFRSIPEHLLGENNDE